MLVYGLKGDFGFCSIHKTKGSALDAFPSYYAADMHIEELHIPEPENGSEVFYDEDHDKWFSGVAEAEAHGCKHPCIFQLEDRVQAYDLNEKKFVVLMQRTERGWYARINAHPELYGEKGAGAAFFPHHNWNPKEIHEGLAEVSIVRDCKNYGFIQGKMLTLTAPGRRKFAVYCRDNIFSNAEYIGVEKRITDAGDSFYKLDSSITNTNTSACYSCIDGGEIEEIPEIDGATLIWKMELKDFLLSEFFSGKGDELQAYCKMAQIPKTIWEMWDTVWINTVESSDNPLLDWGIRNDLVVGYGNTGTKVYRITSKFQTLCRFRFQEIKRICEEILKENNN